MKSQVESAMWQCDVESNVDHDFCTTPARATAPSPHVVTINVRQAMYKLTRDKDVAQMYTKQCQISEDLDFFVMQLEK